MFSVDDIQQQILDFLEDQLNHPVIDQSIPDIDTVERDSLGRIKPYIAIQFGDLQDDGTRSMIGVRGNDYRMPIYIQSIAPTPKGARGISNRVTNLFLGETFPWAGTVRKRAGGGMWPITNSNFATEAYMMPASFSLVLELANY